MIKRFNPDFSLSISHELAYMRETPEGGYVAHGDYATLFSELEVVKADRDALAVENAALINVFGPGEAVVNFLSIALRHTEYDCIDLPDVALAFKMSLPETPATDATLAAIEARVWAEAKDLAKSMLATDSADHIDFLFDGKIKQLREGK